MDRSLSVVLQLMKICERSNEVTRRGRQWRQHGGGRSREEDCRQKKETNVRGNSCGGEGGGREKLGWINEVLCPLLDKKMKGNKEG